MFLASAATNADETGVTITGATGTGFFIPTFRIQGTFNDNNPSIQEAVTMCVGLNSSCLLYTPAVSSTGGLLTVDTFFSPAIDSTTQFTFGTPFDFGISMALFFERPNGQPALPGPTVTGDFTNGLQLVSWKVVDASGPIIPGAQVNSQILLLAGAPEPSTFAMIVLALAIAGAMWMKKGTGPTACWPDSIAGTEPRTKLLRVSGRPKNVPEDSLNRDRTASREYKSDVCLKHRFPNVGPERRYSVRHGDGVP